MVSLPRTVISALVVASVGFVISLLPMVVDLEETLDLALLFRLRGPRPAPRDVVLVAVDRESADRLEVADEPEDWPRGLHARLIDRLAAAGARLIVFDLFFEQPRAAVEDEALAAAVGRAGNVVLCAYLKRDSLPLRDGGGLPRGDLVLERLVPPLEPLRLAARGVAPFPLPRIPVRANQWWVFKSSAGEIPTLPVVALQALALPDAPAWEGLRTALGQAGGGLEGDAEPPADSPGPHDRLRRLRAHLRADPERPRAVLTALGRLPRPREAPDAPRLLQALVRACAGPTSIYLNFFGPPGSIPTLAYHQALELTAGDLARAVGGRIVFVGSSERFRQEQRDGIHTVYSAPGRPDLSGVEIAATALDNLLHDEVLRPLGPLAYGALMCGWGLLLGFVGLRLAPPVAVAAVGLLVAGYLGLAVARFSAFQWWPLTVPVLVQAPLALVLGLAWRYVEVSRERGKIRAAFGLYLPDPVVDQIARSMETVRQDGEQVYGVCLITDAERYTTLSESVDPTQLGRFMNRFYETIFEPVRAHGGIITDVVGDSMMAVWTSAAPSPQLRDRACRSALEVLRAVDRFNRAQSGLHLPVRIGLHAGAFMVGHIGAIDHFEYRAVGDVVNTASRIEALNKQLGTRALASRRVLEGLEGYPVRALGRFLLAGKSVPIEICELLEAEAWPGVDFPLLERLFARGRETLERRRWEEAAALFAQCLQIHGADGPSAFYLETCRRFREEGPGEGWDGTLRLDAK